MTERRAIILYRIACAIALLLVYAAAIIGWTKYFQTPSANYLPTVILFAGALAVWLTGRMLYFLYTGR